MLRSRKPYAPTDDELMATYARPLHHYRHVPLPIGTQFRLNDCQAAHRPGRAEEIGDLRHRTLGTQRFRRLSLFAHGMCSDRLPPPH